MGGPLGKIFGSLTGGLLESFGDSRRPTGDEYRDIIIKGMMSSSKAGGDPISREDAEAKYDAMSPEDQDNLRVQITSRAREGSDEKAAYDEMEGDVRKSRADQFETATNQRIESLKDDDYTRI